MKRIKNLFFIAITAITFVACKNAPNSVEAKTSNAKDVSSSAETTVLNINKEVSKVIWVGTKVSAYHAGEIKIISGNLLVKEGVLSGGKFTLDMNSILLTNGDEGSNVKLIGHLKSPDFFDVPTYPEASFEITSVNKLEGSVSATSEGNQTEFNEYALTDPNVTIGGNLTIKGITKNIEFPAKVNISDTGSEAIAKFNINRKDWGIVYPGMPDDLIKDMIWFGINLKTIN